MAAQAGLSLTWSETPEDTFSRGAAQMFEPIYLPNGYMLDCLKNFTLKYSFFMLIEEIKSSRI